MTAYPSRVCGFFSDSSCKAHNVNWPSSPIGHEFQPSLVTTRILLLEDTNLYFVHNETKLPFIVCWLYPTLHISSQHHRAANIHIVSHPHSKEYLRPDWFQESEKNRALLGGFWPSWPQRAQISFVSLSGLMFRILPASEKPVLLSLFSDGKFKLWARSTCENRLSYDFGVEIYHLLCLSFVGPLRPSWICIWEFKTFLFTTVGSPIATFFRGDFIWPLRGTI